MTRRPSVFQRVLAAAAASLLAAAAAGTASAGQPLVFGESDDLKVDSIGLDFGSGIPLGAGVFCGLPAGEIDCGDALSVDICVELDTINLSGGFQLDPTDPPVDGDPERGPGGVLELSFRADGELLRFLGEEAPRFIYDIDLEYRRADGSVGSITAAALSITHLPPSDPPTSGGLDLLDGGGPIVGALNVAGAGQAVFDGGTPEWSSSDEFRFELLLEVDSPSPGDDLTVMVNRMAVHWREFGGIDCSDGKNGVQPVDATIFAIDADDNRGGIPDFGDPIDGSTLDACAEDETVRADGEADLSPVAAMDIGDVLGGPGPGDVTVSAIVIGLVRASEVGSDVEVEWDIDVSLEPDGARRTAGPTPRIASAEVRIYNEFGVVGAIGLSPNETGTTNLFGSGEVEGQFFSYAEPIRMALVVELEDVGEDDVFGLVVNEVAFSFDGDLDECGEDDETFDNLGFFFFEDDEDDEEFDFPDDFIAGVCAGGETIRGFIDVQIGGPGGVDFEDLNTSSPEFVFAFDGFVEDPIPMGPVAVRWDVEVDYQPGAFDLGGGGGFDGEVDEVYIELAINDSLRGGVLGEDFARIDLCGDGSADSCEESGSLDFSGQANVFLPSDLSGDVDRGGSALFVAALVVRMEDTNDDDFIRIRVNEVSVSFDCEFTPCEGAFTDELTTSDPRDDRPNDLYWNRVEFCGIEAFDSFNDDLPRKVYPLRILDDGQVFVRVRSLEENPIDFDPFLIISCVPEPPPSGWKEDVDGPLSDDPSLPTPAPLVEGDNAFCGDSFAPIPASFEGSDFFTVTVPEGLAITAIIQDEYTSDVPNNMTFLGVDVGSTYVNFPNPNSHGFAFMSDANEGTDLLPAMAFSNNNFEDALGPGDYTFWIREAQAFDLLGQQTAYNFRIVLAEPPMDGMGSMARGSSLEPPEVPDIIAIDDDSLGYPNPAVGFYAEEDQELLLIVTSYSNYPGSNDGMFELEIFGEAELMPPDAGGAVCCYACDPAPAPPCPDASGAVGAPCTEVPNQEACEALGGTYRADRSCSDPIDPCACEGDVNGDGATNVFDFNTVTGFFGQGAPDCVTRFDGDLTCDGVVDVFDFNRVTGDFGCRAEPIE